MRSASGIVWALLVGGILLGGMALFASKYLWGPDGPEQLAPYVNDARELDAQTKAHLEELGIRFAPNESRDPALSLDNPSEADFAFLDGILAGNDPKARVSAAKVLRDIGQPRSVEPLVAQAARSADEKESLFDAEAALTILSDKPPATVRATLIPALARHDGDLSEDLVRGFRHALEQAGALDPAFLRDAAVSDRDPLVRRFALGELARGPKPPLGVFAAALGDPDAAVRADAEAKFAQFHHG